MIFLSLQAHSNDNLLQFMSENKLAKDSYSVFSICSPIVSPTLHPPQFFPGKTIVPKLLEVTTRPQRCTLGDVLADFVTCVLLRCRTQPAPMISLPILSSLAACGCLFRLRSGLGPLGLGLGLMVLVHLPPHRLLSQIADDPCGVTAPGER